MHRLIIIMTNGTLYLALSVYNFVKAIYRHACSYNEYARSNFSSLCRCWLTHFIVHVWMASLFKRQAIIIKLGKDVRIIGFVSKQKQVSFRAYYINMSSPPLYLLHYIFRINLKMISHWRDVTFWSTHHLYSLQVYIFAVCYWGVGQGLFVGIVYTYL